MNGKGFWANDGLLETWLLALVREMNQVESPPEWLRQVREDWGTQGMIGYQGMLGACLRLDETLQYEASRETLIRLSEQALQSLLNGFIGDDLPISDWQMSDNCANFEPFWQRVNTVYRENTLRTGITFLRLLRRKITWQVSDEIAVQWLYEETFDVTELEMTNQE